MDRIKLNDYLKKINPEFKDVENKLLEQLPNAYLLDNNDGLKKYCGCVNLKSVDFLLKKDGELYFIEFSDLNSEDASIRKNIDDQIKCCKKQKEKKIDCPVKDYPKQLQNMKSNDFVLKYKDTILLLYLIKNNLEPEDIFDEDINKWHYLIVYNKEPNTDLIKYLDLLKSSIQSSLPAKILNRNNFKLQTLNMFIKSLKLDLFS